MPLSPGAPDAFLARSQQLLGAAITQTDAVIIIDAHGCISYLNPRAAAQYEVDAAVALGLPLTSLYRYEWLHPGDEAASQRALDAEGWWRGENRHILPSGRTLHVEATVTRVHDGGGEPHLVAVLRDMTAQKQALLETQQRFRLALQAAPMVIAHMDRELRYTWIHNPHPDFSPESVLGKRDDELGHDPGTAALVAAKQLVLTTGQAQRTEFSVGLSDGLHTYDITISPLLDAGGQVAGLTSAALDVTAQRAAAEQVRHSEARLRRVMATSQIGILLADAGGTITQCNDALLQMFGCTRAEYQRAPLNWRSFTLPHDAAANEEFVAELQRTGIVRPVARTFARRDGLPLPAMLSAALLETPAGTPDADTTPAAGTTDAASTPAEHIAFVVDLTELKQAQAALQELNATLEARVAARTAELARSNAELDRFAYIASHDLRAPLRAVGNLAKWIEEDAGPALPPKAARHLAQLRGRVQRLENLLEDLLQYSRVGRHLHAPEWVDPAALIRGIVEMLNPPAGFQVLIAGELPVVRCERTPLETVLRNLIQNAVKHHTDPATGVVTVSAAPAAPLPDPGGTEMVTFCIRDNGPGIASEFHARIFEVFQTLRPRDTVEGSGMGLAIVKKTVETMGGRIWVESAPGAGAAFYFTWPRQVHQ